VRKMEVTNGEEEIVEVEQVREERVAKERQINEMWTKI